MLERLVIYVKLMKKFIWWQVYLELTSYFLKRVQTFVFVEKGYLAEYAPNFQVKSLDLNLQLWTPSYFVS